MGDSIEKSQENQEESCPRKKQKTASDTNKNSGDGSADQSILSKFQIKKVLRDSTREKNIFIHGEVGSCLAS